MSAQELEDWVALGVVARPHGVRGEVRVHVYNPDSTLLEERTKVYLKPKEGKGREATIVQARPGPKALLVAFEDCTTREKAEALRGYELCLARSDLPSLGSGEFYFIDLIGAEVQHQETRIGSVVEILEYPSVTCLAVATEKGRLELPLLPQWIANIDAGKGIVETHALDDLPLEAPKKSK